MGHHHHHPTTSSDLERPPLYVQHKINPGWQQGGELEVVHHVQREHYQRKAELLLVVKLVTLESSQVHKRSPMTINQSPNHKFMGLSLSTINLFITLFSQGKLAALSWRKSRNSKITRDTGLQSFSKGLLKWYRAIRWLHLNQFKFKLVNNYATV